MILLHAGSICDRVLATDPFFSFHHVNAFETEGGAKVVVDTAAMDGGVDFSLSLDNGTEALYKRLAGRAVLTRLVLDLNCGTVGARHAHLCARALMLKGCCLGGCNHAMR
jgi:carotenoid cleavage dioxygenase-like enzyme